jgi:hypothetical protein
MTSSNAVAIDEFLPARCHIMARPSAKVYVVGCTYSCGAASADMLAADPTAREGIAAASSSKRAIQTSDDGSHPDLIERHRVRPSL